MEAAVGRGVHNRRATSGGGAMRPRPLVTARVTRGGVSWLRALGDRRCKSLAASLSCTAVPRHSPCCPSDGSAQGHARAQEEQLRSITGRQILVRPSLLARVGAPPRMDGFRHRLRGKEQQRRPAALHRQSRRRMPCEHSRVANQRPGRAVERYHGQGNKHAWPHPCSLVV
ncbi:unnamed protein product [Urochloa humidicola]